MDGDLLLLASSKVINELRFCACGERCSESWWSWDDVGVDPT